MRFTKKSIFQIPIKNANISRDDLDEIAVLNRRMNALATEVRPRARKMEAEELKISDETVIFFHYCCLLKRKTAKIVLSMSRLSHYSYHILQMVEDGYPRVVTVNVITRDNLIEKVFDSVKIKSHEECQFCEVSWPRSIILSCKFRQVSQSRSKT